MTFDLWKKQNKQNSFTQYIIKYFVYLGYMISFNHSYRIPINEV